MCSFRFFIVLFCLVAFTACEKEELEGDTSILIGSWNWTKTYKVGNYCDAESLWNYQLTDSTSANNRYSLEFLETGKVIFYTNDAIIFRKRVVFESKKMIDNGISPRTQTRNAPKCSIIS
jgi:hypothetical protein